MVISWVYYGVLGVWVERVNLVREFYHQFPACILT